jgi:surface antigen
MQKNTAIHATLLLICCAAFYTWAVRESRAESNGEFFGAVTGASLGGIVGNQFGHGYSRAASTSAGIVAGGYAGDRFGASFDRPPQLYGATSYASYPYYNTEPYSTTYVPTYVAPPVPPPIYVDNSSGGYCRQYSQQISVDGRTQEQIGTACLQDDGSWREVDTQP